MSNAATIIAFPAAPSPEKPSRAEELARIYLAAKRMAEQAEAAIKALAPELIEAMQAEGKRGVSVAGAGHVSLVVTAEGTRVDQRAAVSALITAGIEVPMVPSKGGTSLRASLE